MFKYYLTYQFAVSFHQLSYCAETEHTLDGTKKKERLMRSAEQMLQSFTKAVHARDLEEEGIQMYSTLVNLRDCREILLEMGLFSGDFLIKYDLIHGRLERICESIAKEQGGQLRMLG